MLKIYLTLLFFSLAPLLVQSTNITEKYYFLAENNIPESRLLINNEKKKIIKNKEEIKNKKVKKIKSRKKKEEIQGIQNKELKEKYLKQKIIINFASDSEEPSVEEINFFYKKITNFNKRDRITIKGYAEKRTNDSTSKARRLSLKRALFLRSLFLEENYEITDIYIRALGHNGNIEGNKDIVVITNN